MQDMLVPIFGENGAIIVQYAITLAVIVVLIALVVWGIRRYGGGAVRPAVRGRLPRLAIVDALPVDNKRKLVLLRRDNVEHLVLIGGPSDIVVEPSIVRQRVAQRPGQATAVRAPAAVTPADAAPSEAQAADAGPIEADAGEPSAPGRAAPIEAETTTRSTLAFTPRRTAIGGSERPALERSERHEPSHRRDPLRGTATAAALTEPARSYRSRRPEEEAPEPEQPAMASPPVRPASLLRPERASSRFVPPPADPEEPPGGPVPGYESAAEEQDHDAVSAFGPTPHEADPATGAEPGESAGAGREAEVAAAPAPAEGEPPEGAAQPEDVSELELEMARLLDQISTSRRE